ncbi:MAG: hypothetical protein WAU33_08235 [Candidatus Binataceae bacterium]
MSYRSYSSIGFEVWNNARSWYWLVKNPAHGIGSIGAAPTEADAVGEACAAIEEIFAQENASMRELRRCQHAGMPDWMASLQNLERFLACVNRASA